MLKFRRVGNEKGITLVAVIITIIVLLILAGVSISTLSGNDGVLTKAREANEKTLNVQDLEELKLAISDLKIDNHEASTSSFIDFLLNSEEYLKSKLSSSNLQVDKENKKIMYKGNIYSLNDVGNLNQESKGISLNRSNLDLQIIGENKQEETLEIIKLNLDGDVTWETSNEAVAKVENGKVTPISEGETVITATCMDGVEYKASCKVKVEAFIDDSYVQYDVEYDDIYSGKRYTKNTGWRLITQEQNGDGTYNIEFISTGIPCKLCYGWYEIGSAIWKPTVEQKNEYVNKFYNTASNRNATYAGAGLYCNFAKIPFRKQISSEDRNIGGYTNIITKNRNKIMEEASGEITGEIFIAKKDAKVRNVTLSDIRGYDKIEGKESGGVKAYNSGDEYADKKIGLFKLNDYFLDNSRGKNYFLANPNGITSSYHIPFISSTGTVGSSNGGRTVGLRPVITMQNVNMTKNGCVWIINE